MRFSSHIAAAVLALAAFTTPALADDVSDRSEAIQLCRAEVASRTGLGEDQVRLDSVRTRPRLVRVDLDVWSEAGLQNVRCEVSRGGGELQIASIEPALRTASN